MTRKQSLTTCSLAIPVAAVLILGGLPHAPAGAAANGPRVPRRAARLRPRRLPPISSQRPRTGTRCRAERRGGHRPGIGRRQHFAGASGRRCPRALHSPRAVNGTKALTTRSSRRLNRLPSAPGKVEVLEVFSAGCPHCYALEPTIRQWLKTKPSYVQYVRVPVMWGPRP